LKVPLRQRSKISSISPFECRPIPSERAISNFSRVSSTFDFYSQNLYEPIKQLRSNHNHLLFGIGIAVAGATILIQDNFNAKEPGDDKKYSDYVENAKNLLLLGDFAKAESLARVALQDYPYDELMLIFQQLAIILQGRYMEVDKGLVTKLFPKTPTEKYYYGLLLKHIEDPRYISMIEQAANQNLKEAEVELATWMLHGLEQGDTKNVVKGVALLKKNGSLASKLALSSFYFTNEEYDKVLQVGKDMIDKNFGPGYFVLGYLNYHGAGMPVNKEEAMKYFQQGALLGHSNSQFYYANMLLDEGKVDEAYEMFKKVAPNIPRAYVILSDMHRVGAGHVEKSNDLATQFLKEGTMRNDPECMFIYGEKMYWESNLDKGVTPTNIVGKTNASFLKDLFLRCSSYGHPECKFYLAKILAKEGKQKQSEELLKEAHEDGSVLAKRYFNRPLTKPLPPSTTTTLPNKN